MNLKRWNKRHEVQPVKMNLKNTFWKIYSSDFERARSMTQATNAPSLFLYAPGPAEQQRLENYRTVELLCGRLELGSNIQHQLSAFQTPNRSGSPSVGASITYTDESVRIKFINEDFIRIAIPRCIALPETDTRDGLKYLYFVGFNKARRRGRLEDEEMLGQLETPVTMRITEGSETQASTVATRKRTEPLGTSEKKRKASPDCEIPLSRKRLKYP